VSQIAGSQISCGIQEIHSLWPWNPKQYENRKDNPIFTSISESEYSKAQVLGLRKNMFESEYHVTYTWKPGMLFTFSDADVYGNGLAFAKWLKQEGLVDGEMTEIGPTINPNSKNEIRMWIFKYNGKKPTKYTVD